MDKQASLRALAGCADCEILNASTVDLPLTGHVVYQAKLRRADGEYVAIAIDELNNVVDVRSMLGAEGLVVFARQGALRDDLYALSLRDSDEIVPVWIWVNVKDSLVPKDKLWEMNQSDQDAYELSLTDNVRAKTSKVVGWLEGRGYKIIERGEYTPAITADVPASSLRALGQLEAVSAVGLREPGRPTATTWHRASHLDAAQVIVPSTGWSFCNSEGERPDNYSVLNVSATASATSGTSPHMTWTTELIAATSGSRAAPDAVTYIANWGGFGTAEQVWAWCFWTKGARSLNFSHTFASGAPSARTSPDMTFDYYARRSPYPLIVASAGNDGHVSGYDTVQNRANNALVVGASNDNNTDVTSDDTMAYFSSWRNPLTTHSDAEYPHLVAPGVNISSVSVTGNGTSAAAPIALGATLLGAERYTMYYSWPEMSRATALAASTYPVSGVRTLSLSGISDIRQGAGLLNAKALVKIAVSGNFRNPNSAAVSIGHGRKTVYFGDDFDMSGRSYDAYNIKIPSGVYVLPRIRVAIAFDSSSSNGCVLSDGSGCTARRA